MRTAIVTFSHPEGRTQLFVAQVPTTRSEALTGVNMFTRPKQQAVVMLFPSPRALQSALNERYDWLRSTAPFALTLRETPFPLDIVWIGRGSVLDVVEHAPAYSTSPYHAPPGAEYALELLAGLAVDLRGTQVSIRFLSS